MPTPEQIAENIRALVKDYAAARPSAPFRPGQDRVQYAGRVYDGAELVNLVDSALEFWLTAGRYTEEFETRLAQFIGVESALFVNSGSSANLAAFAALTSPRLRDRAVRPGDEVITVAAAFPTTVNPILQHQAVPVFIDVELGSYVPTLEQIEAAIGPRTRAVFIAHTLGVPFPVAEVRALCNRRKLWLIEDNCDALGSRYAGKPTGSFGDLATGSFYPAHHITTGEGGVVLTNNPELAQLARSFRDWGRDCYCPGGKSNTCGRRFSGSYGELPFGYDHKYVYSHIGYNFQATDLQAAIGCAQLTKLPAFVEARKRNHAALAQGLRRHEDCLILHHAPPQADPSWFAYVLTVRPEAPFDRAALVKHLEQGGVETRHLFSGNILRHPAYLGIPHRVCGRLDHSDLITTNSFFVGVYPGITDPMVQHMLALFDGFLGARKNA